MCSLPKTGVANKHRWLLVKLDFNIELEYIDLFAAHEMIHTTQEID